MDPSLLLRGLAIGFSIAAPIGPISVLCIRRTLTQGRTSGILTGLGAATADAIYGSIAALGITLVSNFLIAQKSLLHLIGGSFLCYLGIKTLLSKPPDDTTQIKNMRLAGAYASTLLLTLTNPMTIISFAAVFAGLGITENTNGNYINPAIIVLGVFIGSISWWLILTGITGLFHSKFNPDRLKWLNRTSGIIITLFGLIVLFSLTT